MPPEVTNLFNLLESNREDDVNKVKSEFSSMFNSIKEPWLVNMLVQYHIETGSLRPIEILVKVPESHSKYVFDKMDEGIRASWKIVSLSMLGHIVRHNPTWLYRITNHNIMKSLLKLLKCERDIVALMSSLLVLITLLPMIPMFINQFIQEIFEIFSRLAAWDLSNKNNEFINLGHREHLQLGLYGLFYNLYGMYPCNFIDYLKNEYSRRETQEVFNHTIKPMLETVKMHPLLVVASKQQEMHSARWQKMEHHDIFVECRRFSLEGSEQQNHVDIEENRFRSRCGTDVASRLVQNNQFELSKASTSAPNLTESHQTQMQTTLTQAESNSVAYISRKHDSIDPGSDKWFSLANTCDLGSAISAPHTPLPVATNIQDNPSRTPNMHLLQSQDGGSPPEAAIEATPENTPIKDLRSNSNKFNFPNNPQAVRSINKGLNHLSSLSSFVNPSQSQPPSPLKKEQSPFSKIIDFSDHEVRKDIMPGRLNKVLHDRALAENFMAKPQYCSSPIKKSHPYSINSSIQNSNLPLASGPTSNDRILIKPKSQRDCVNMDTLRDMNMDTLNKEDLEVSELIMRSPYQSDADITPAETPEIIKPTYTFKAIPDFTQDLGECYDDDICEGSDHQCKNHGLHMPQSSSMLDFAKKLTNRIRNYSLSLSFANASCSSSFPKSRMIDFKMQKDRSLVKMLSCPDLSMSVPPKREKSVSVAIQTVDTRPEPYEYLLSDVYQGFYDMRGKARLDDQPTTNNKISHAALTERLDNFIETLCRKTPEVKKLTEREEIDKLKEQLQLTQLQLLYERHRKEIHSIRNRRLLGKCRKNRAMEEQNLALTSQVKVLQEENESLKDQITKLQNDIQQLKTDEMESSCFYHSQILELKNTLDLEQVKLEKLSGEYQELNKKYMDENSDIQHLHSEYFDLAQKLEKALKKSKAVDRLQEHLRAMQRELLICGERETRISEAISTISPGNDIYLNKVLRQYKEEVASMQETLNLQTGRLETLQSREVDLESSLTQKESLVQDLKKQIRLIREEYGEKIQCVEDKYQSLIRINQKLEAHCLDLLQRVPHSPHTLSRDVTSGFSPQSSPLSASLASSEGQVPPLASQVDELRNLQVILDADDTTSNAVMQNSDEDPH